MSSAATCMSVILSLRTFLPLLDNALTTDEMLELNYKVDVDGATPEQAAHDFLVEKDLFPGRPSCRAALPGSTK